MIQLFTAPLAARHILIWKDNRTAAAYINHRRAARSARSEHVDSAPPKYDPCPASAPLFFFFFSQSAITRPETGLDHCAHLHNTTPECGAVTPRANKFARQTDHWDFKSEFSQIRHKKLRNMTAPMSIIRGERGGSSR